MQGYGNNTVMLCETVYRSLQAHMQHRSETMQLQLFLLVLKGSCMPCVMCGGGGCQAACLCMHGLVMKRLIIW